MARYVSEESVHIIPIGSQFVNNSPGSDNSYIIDASSEIPIILVNGYLAGDNIYCVMCNDHDAVYNAASELLYPTISSSSGTLIPCLYANFTAPTASESSDVSKVEQLSSNAVDLLMEVLGGGSVSNINTVTADLIKRQTTKF